MPDLETLLAIPDDQMAAVQSAMIEAAEAIPGGSLNESAIERIARDGKRLRSRLFLKCVESMDMAVDQRLIYGAAAVELLHEATLSHDDVMDGAEQRSSAPTLNNAKGDEHATLVGIHLNNAAYLPAVKAGPKVVEKVATTAMQLAHGQNIEDRDRGNFKRSLKDYMLSIRGKTGSSFALACEIPVILGGMPDKVISAYRQYGYAMGMERQVLDDLLDNASTTEQMGKRVGDDANGGVYNAPVLFARQGDPDDDPLYELLNEPSPSLATGIELINLIVARGAIMRTVEEARMYSLKAPEVISGLDEWCDVTDLKRIPGAYLNYMLEKVVLPI